MAATGTDMAAKKKTRTERKKSLVLMLPALLLIQGCQAGSVEMTSELASQIASDASGLNKEEITDLTCAETDDGYTVSFQGDNGKYTIGVSPDGKVTAYQFEKADDESSEEDSSQEKPAQENNSGESENTGQEENSDDDSNSSQDDLQLPEGSLSRSQLIQATADHLQKKDYKEEDFTLTLRDDGMVEVAVQGDDGRNYTVTVNPQNGQIIYTLFSY